MEGTREAEMIVQFSLQGMMYALRLTGAGTEKIAALLIALHNQPQTSPGVVRMQQLLKSGEPLDYYSVPEGRMREFAALARDYGIQYCTALNADGVYDLVVKKSDSARINRIGERLGLGTVEGSMQQDVTEQEREHAENLTPAQEMMQDMMSPNQTEAERGKPENPGRKLPENEASGSFYQGTERESIRERMENYEAETESARDMFQTARDLRVRMTEDLPDGMEPVIADIGWTPPGTEDLPGGGRTYRGKKGDEMTDTDRMQYLLDTQMKNHGNLDEAFIRQMYLSGYRVDEYGMVKEAKSTLDGREKLLIADMMKKPDRQRGQGVQKAAETVKEGFS